MSERPYVAGHRRDKYPWAPAGGGRVNAILRVRWTDGWGVRASSRARTVTVLASVFVSRGGSPRISWGRRCRGTRDRAAGHGVDEGVRTDPRQAGRCAVPRATTQAPTAARSSCPSLPPFLFPCFLCFGPPPGRWHGWPAWPRGAALAWRHPPADVVGGHPHHRHRGAVTAPSAAARGVAAAATRGRAHRARLPDDASARRRCVARTAAATIGEAPATRGGPFAAL